MSTRETQKIIIETAISLFNEHGTKAISTNRIADECALSRGHLHYHFRTKEEIIQTIFQQIDREMDGAWYEDHKHPSMRHAHFMFERQVDLFLRYRFFYWELYALLRKDARLKLLFIDSRKKREKEVQRFFEALVERGLMVAPEPPVTLESLLQISWLVSDHWIYHLELKGEEVNTENIRKGFKLIYQGFEPYLTPKAMAEYQQVLQYRKQPDQGAK